MQLKTDQVHVVGPIHWMQAAPKLL